MLKVKLYLLNIKKNVQHYWTKIHTPVWPFVIYTYNHLINMFLKFCIDMVFCLLRVGWGKQQLLLSVCFWQATLWQKWGVFCLEKNASTIQYDYRKCGTQVRVFSRTPVHGNRTIEIRQRNRVRMQADRVEMEISKAGMKEKKSRPPNCLSGLPYPLVTTSRSSEWIT